MPWIRTSPHTHSTQPTFAELVESPQASHKCARALSEHAEHTANKMDEPSTPPPPLHPAPPPGSAAHACVRVGTCGGLAWPSLLRPW